MTFFKNLAQNNSSNWFNENRRTYENEVKIPFNEFIEHIISLINKDGENIEIKAADTIFRINRDIRFSKDKTPYKLHMSANISSMGKKNKTYPGLYLQVSPEEIMIGGGAYELEKDEINKIRNYILNHHKEFKKIYSDKTFESLFGDVRGESNKKLNPEHKALEATEPLIANKQFYYMATIDADVATKPGFDKLIMKYYKAGKKMNEFLIKAMK